MSENATTAATTDATTPRPDEGIIYARLTGPCDDHGGYGFEEVVDAPGGTWEREPAGRTGVAHEVNGSTSLDGNPRVFVLRKGPRTGEWRFESGAGYWV